MDSLFPIPTIFAHRGSSVDAPENTLAAFELAVHQNAHAIELDVQLSKDNHLVVIHDHHVDRTTNGKGLVQELDLKVLKELDAGSYRDSKFSAEKIPTLSEVFEAVGQKILINIELKNDSTPMDDLPVRVASVVKAFSMQSRVIFSSFNPIALRRVKKELPDTACGVLTSPGSRDVIPNLLVRLMIRKYEALHPEASTVTPALIRKEHTAKRRIHVYTVNDAEEMRKLLSMGVDGIFTDRPGLAMQILTGMG